MSDILKEALGLRSDALSVQHFQDLSMDKKQLHFMDSVMHAFQRLSIWAFGVMGYKAYQMLFGIGSF
jgi:hypothetical protein